MNALLKFIANPMLAFSLVLHGLLLMAPLPPEPQAASQPEPEPEEEVKLSSISSLKVAPPPSPVPQPLPTPKPILRPAVPRPAAALPRPVAPQPVPTPLPTPVASPTPVAAATPAPSPSPVPTPMVTPSPTAPLAQGSLQSSAIQGVGQVSAAQFYTNFPDPSSFFTAESLAQADATFSAPVPVDPVPVDGITNMTRLERIGLDQAFNDVLPQMYPGATFAKVGTYGGGDLYEVRQGGSVGYVVLVKEKGLSLATFIVEWNRNPSQVASQPAG